MDRYNKFITAIMIAWVIVLIAIMFQSCAPAQSRYGCCQSSGTVGFGPGTGTNLKNVYKKHR